MNLLIAKKMTCNINLKTLKDCLTRSPGYYINGQVNGIRHDNKDIFHITKLRAMGKVCMCSRSQTPYTIYEEWKSRFEYYSADGPVTIGEICKEDNLGNIPQQIGRTIHSRLD